MAMCQDPWLLYLDSHDSPSNRYRKVQILKQFLIKRTLDKQLKAILVFRRL